MVFPVIMQQPDTRLAACFHESERDTGTEMPAYLEHGDRETEINAIEGKPLELPRSMANVLMPQGFIRKNPLRVAKAGAR